MQLIHKGHGHQVPLARWPWAVVKTAFADLEQLGLLGDMQLDLRVNHGFALSNFALVRALSIKSSSKIYFPILACNWVKLGPVSR